WFLEADHHVVKKKQDDFLHENLHESGCCAGACADADLPQVQPAAKLFGFLAIVFSGCAIPFRAEIGGFCEGLEEHLIEAGKVIAPADKLLKICVVKEEAFFADEEDVRNLAVGAKTKECFCYEGVLVYVLFEKLVELGE